MNYVYSQISNATMCVQQELANAKLLHSKGIYPTETTGVKKKYIKDNGGKWMLDSNGKRRFLLFDTGHHESKELSERTIKHLEDALITMRLAAIYAERVEWLTSGDDSEQTFCERLEKMLAKARKTGGVE